MSLNIEMNVKDPRHKRILEAFDRRWESATRERDKQKGKFEMNDEQFRAYIPETENDALRREKRERSGQPQYTTLIVPHSYAVAMTAHTYLTSVFMGRNPVFQFTARHGEPEMQVQAIEALADYQLHVGKMLVPLYIWILDALKNGEGIIGCEWAVDRVNVTEIIEVEDKYLGVIPTGRFKKVRRVSSTIGYEGNTLFNIHPLDFVWDTRVALTHFQKGEFAGYTFKPTWNEVVRKGASGEFFNIEELEKDKNKATWQQDWGSADVDYPEGVSYDTDKIPDIGTVECSRLYIDLIPRNWKLGSSDYPEKWIITVADKRTIVELRPFGALHAAFPFALLETEPDSYALFKRSMLETIRPLQQTMDWLVNTHFFNVRSVLNDQFVVDPSLIYMSDLKDPNAGRIIRLRPKAMARGLSEQAIRQLPVTTVTNQHISDTELINNLSQRVSGVNDNIMGLVNTGGRKTATEVRGANSFSTNRLKTVAEFMSAMGWAPLSQIMLQQSQQWLSEEKKLKIVGDLVLPEYTKSFLGVNPESIQGFYDFVPVDGTLPIDRFAQSNLWREILMSATKMPQVMMQYDLGKIFAWMAQIAGLKNINQFRVQVAEPGALQQQLAAGNVVPLRGGGAGGTGSEESFGRAGEPGQLPGMGQTL